jgi:hypothetical protein
VGGVSDVDIDPRHKPLWQHSAASGSESPPADFWRQAYPLFGNSSAYRRQPTVGSMPVAPRPPHGGGRLVPLESLTSWCAFQWQKASEAFQRPPTTIGVNPPIRRDKDDKIPGDTIRKALHRKDLTAIEFCRQKSHRDKAATIDEANTRRTYVAND